MIGQPHTLSATSDAYFAHQVRSLTSIIYNINSSNKPPLNPINNNNAYLTWCQPNKNPSRHAKELRSHRDL